MLKIVNQKFQNEKIFEGGKPPLCNAYFCTPVTPQTFKVLIFSELQKVECSEMSVLLAKVCKNFVNSTLQNWGLFC